ncbi:MAG: hypothetical protein VB914_05705 [Porticoccaceae bacterium]
MTRVESYSSGGSVATVIEIVPVIDFAIRFSLWSSIVTCRPVAVVTTCLSLIMASLCIETAAMTIDT